MFFWLSSATLTKYHRSILEAPRWEQTNTHTHDTMLVAHPRKGSGPQYDNNDILLHTNQQFPVIWTHWPLETWHHTFWHTDTNLSEKKDSGLLGYDTKSLGKGFCVFLRNMWPWFSGIHRPMIHWALEDEGNMVLYNIQKHLASNTLSHPRRPESSITPLSQLQCAAPVYMTSHLPQKTRDIIVVAIMNIAVCVSEVLLPPSSCLVMETAVPLKCQHVSSTLHRTTYLNRVSHQYSSL